jgi:hypothetical protein
MTNREDSSNDGSVRFNSITSIIPPDKESPEYLEKLNQYYSMKYIYELKKQEKMNNIIKNPELSLKQKQEAYSKVKLNCVGCSRRVGTIFENNDGVLSAICGDKTTPCPLNISINTGKFVQLGELIDIFSQGVDSSKTDIIITKLDLLFGYENEQTVLFKFNKFKKELTNDLESLLFYRSKFIDIIENLDNKNKIQVKIDMYYAKIELIKNTMDEYNETGEINLIKDMLVIYQTELMPIISDLNNLKYKYYAMENNSVDNTQHLIKKQYTFSQLLTSFVDPVVNRFNIRDTDGDQLGKNIVDELEFDDDDEEDSPSPVSTQVSSQQDLPPVSVPLSVPVEIKPQIKRIRPNDGGQYGNQDVIMFGNDIIVNQRDFEVNQSIIENNDKISVMNSNNKEKYQQEMIYVSPSNPKLVAIDKNTGKIYVVDFNKSTPYYEENRMNDLSVKLLDDV